MTKTLTAKALGLKKGDCIITSSGFVGVIISDAHTSRPCCEIWGLAHEGGSVYAHELRKISADLVKTSQCFLNDPKPFSKEARKALDIK